MSSRYPSCGIFLHLHQPKMIKLYRSKDCQLTRSSLCVVLTHAWLQDTSAPDTRDVPFCWGSEVSINFVHIQ